MSKSSLKICLKTPPQPQVKILETDSVHVAPNKMKLPRYPNAGFSSSKYLSEGLTTVCPSDMSFLNNILHLDNIFLLSAQRRTASMSLTISNHISLLRWNPDDIVHLVCPPQTRNGYFFVALKINYTTIASQSDPYFMCGSILQQEVQAAGEPL